MKVQFPDFSKANVLVVGDVMLDRYWHGQVSRISPEAPVPVVHVNQIEERPGGAGNVALNIVALGANVDLLGMTGDDAVVDALEAQLNAAQVRTHFQRMPHVPTVTKLRVLSRHQQLIRLDFEEKFHETDVNQLSDAVQTQLSSASVMILSDYGKGTLHRTPALIRLAREANVPVFVDPKTPDFSVYAGATLITPNLKEYEAAVGPCDTEQVLVDKGQDLMQRFDIQALLVTRGAQGMTLLQQGQEEIHLPAREHEVFDVTGAGDTVIATMAAAFAGGQSLAEAMQVANLAAGIVVTKLGAATVSVPELELALWDKRPAESGTLNEEQLLLAVQEARHRKERIVMTNGCFDILHVGHVAYLQQAKALGDRLIVAVNTDESVKKLKGTARPVNNLEQRMTVLASLGVVDWVVPFSEDTPARLIGRVLPDVLVKGGDYKPEEIAGADAVVANGGKVEILTFVEGVSTSAIIDKLKK